MRINAAKHRAARWTAIGRHVKLRQHHTLDRQRIDPRGCDLRAEYPDIRIPQIVSDDEEDIWPG
jgi:DNA-binding transcriptional LysR family regulator